MKKEGLGTQDIGAPSQEKSPEYDCAAGLESNEPWEKETRNAEIQTGA